MLARARVRSAVEMPQELICCEVKSEAVDRDFAGRILTIDTNDGMTPLLIVCGACKRRLHYKLVRVVGNGYVPLDALDIDEGVEDVNDS